MTTAMRQKWEYKREPAYSKGDDLRISMLEGFGRDGWELVDVVPAVNPPGPHSLYGQLVGWYLLKRPKE